MSHSPIHLEQAQFNNSFVDELHGEVAANNHPRQVPGYLYSRLEPTPVADPRLLAWSDEMGAHLGVQKPEERGPAVDILGGNLVASSMKPFAARYGGHQFGTWAGQLGDGRAISLGELHAVDGSSWELQLKGAGRTPYSRQGDGRAVLRSSIREFLCSEAMHHLGVPTTRALSLVSTGDAVVRDMFYSGDPRPEPGAIVCRVAPTFVRFGNFQILQAHGETENLRSLADYVIRHFYPEFGEPSEAVYLSWFEEISRRTAEMIVHWMTVGFVHGVMNTDNMSILGVTVDYGPYGWLEPYEPDWTPNTTDFGMRRYAFRQQARIAHWNLAALAHALTPLIPDEEALQQAMDTYRVTLTSGYHNRMLEKIGLTRTEGEDDSSLLEELQVALVDSQVDMTLFFRHLSYLAPEFASAEARLGMLGQTLIERASYLEADDAAHAALQSWLPQYAERLQHESLDAGEIQQAMLRANPKYVLRNYLAQRAIEAAEADDLSVLHRLMHALKTPFDEQPEYEEFVEKRPEWARTRPGCATLSCSS